MFNKKVTRDTVRERMIEEHKARPGTFFHELGSLVADFHDFQQATRKICRGKFSNISYPFGLVRFDFIIFLETISYLSWVGRHTWNLCEYETYRRRQEHARKQLASSYEKHFVTDCRLKSLISRLNRCSKSYSAGLFSGVDGVRVSGYPVVTFDCSGLSSVVKSDFNMTWGGPSGVDSELYRTCREALLSEYTISQRDTSYAPRFDPIRILLGQEFSYCFNRRDKRQRSSSSNGPSEVSSKGIFLYADTFIAIVC